MSNDGLFGGKPGLASTPRPLASIRPVSRPNGSMGHNVEPVKLTTNGVPASFFGMQDVQASGTVSESQLSIAPAAPPVAPKEIAAEPAAPKETENTVVAARTPAMVKPARATIEYTMPDMGVLQSLMENDEVHDILVTGTQPIYIDAGGELVDSGLRFSSQEEVWKLAEAIVGHRWDVTQPMIDTRLADGSRVNIISPPMSIDGVSLSIRKFPKMRVTMDGMVEKGQISPQVRDFLKAVVDARLNLVVAGGTGSGKTTLLNALSAAISPKERIVTIEDSAELQLQQPHVVRLEAAPAHGADAAHHLGIRDLVKNALRMRPDRIIIGESRGEEAVDMLQAMNTGHDGSMTTLHANSPREALGRLEGMLVMANPQLPMRLLRSNIANTLNVIIQCNRTRSGQRRITHISEVSGMEGEVIILQDLIVFKEDERAGTSEYRWVAGSSRNIAITQAAQACGFMRGFK